jgi:hypothetical protein
LAVCVLAGMLFMIFRNPKKAQQLVLSFLTNEFKMLVALISDIWDIIGTYLPLLVTSHAEQGDCVLAADLCGLPDAF